MLHIMFPDLTAHDVSLPKHTQPQKKKEKKKAKEEQKPERVQATKVGGWREHKGEQSQTHTLKSKRNKQEKQQRSVLVRRYLKSLKPVTSLETLWEEHSKRTTIITRCHGLICEISNRSGQKPISHCLLLPFKTSMSSHSTSALRSIFRMLFKSYSTSGLACVRQH